MHNSLKYYIEKLMLQESNFIPVLLWLRFYTRKSKINLNLVDKHHDLLQVIP